MATPKLALIPTGYKAGKLYSVLPESGVGDFTVVRATEATRVNEEGLIETMGANVPRLDYSGGGCPVLLTEPQRTNSLLQSNQFDTTWSATNSTVTSGQIGVGGSVDAWKLSSTGSLSRLTQTISTSGQKSYTIYAKKGSLNFIRVFARDTSDLNPSVYFDLLNGTISSESEVNDATIQNIGNGWYRCEIVFTKTISNVRIYAAIADGDLSQTSGDIYIQYAQLESGSYPTSYIPTSSSAVTRNGDQVTGAGDAATFNDSEGVLMAEYSDFDNDSFRQLTVSNGSNSNAISIMNTTTENQVVCFVNNGGVTQASISTILNSTHEFNKIAIKYKANDFSVYINGFEIGTDTSGTVPTSLNTLNFDNGAGSGDVYGNTSQVQYFNTVLTDSELETLTSWTSFIEMAQAQNYNII